MPLFEYTCHDCDKEFEALVRASESPECPSCHGTDLERKLSTFAAHTQGGDAASAAQTFGGCGTCGDPRGPGACSMN
jgi:putative FmdB family regulatory protein